MPPPLCGRLGFVAPEPCGCRLRNHRSGGQLPIQPACFQPIGQNFCQRPRRVSLPFCRDVLDERIDGPFHQDAN